MCSTHVLPGGPDRKRTMGPLLCQICRKNSAVVHLTQITKDKKREMHLCEDCAKKRRLPLKSVPGKPGMRARVEPRKKSDKE